MSRHFEICKGWEDKAVLPTRATKYSAGYDFYAANGPYKWAPHTDTLKIDTGIKAIMEPDEVLLIFIRSSLAIKYGLALSNGVGVIDSDFANNPDNDGNICIPLYNPSDRFIQIDKGDRIAQGIFMKYLTTDDDNVTAERIGGVGSTGVK